MGCSADPALLKGPPSLSPQPSQTREHHLRFLLRVATGCPNSIDHVIESAPVNGSHVATPFPCPCQISLMDHHPLQKSPDAAPEPPAQAEAAPLSAGTRLAICSPSPFFTHAFAFHCRSLVLAPRVVRPGLVLNETTAGCVHMDEEPGAKSPPQQRETSTRG